MINQEGDQKGIFGHPQTSFFETIDEPRVIVLVRSAVFLIRKHILHNCIPACHTGLAAF